MKYRFVTRFGSAITSRSFAYQTPPSGPAENLPHHTQTSNKASSLRWVDRTCPSTWTRHDDLRDNNLLANQAVFRYLTSPLVWRIAGPRSFPRTLPSGSACPKTDPPPASSTGYSPSPTPSHLLDLVQPEPSKYSLRPPVVGLQRDRSPPSASTPVPPSVLGARPTSASRKLHAMICSALNRFPAILASPS